MESKKTIYKLRSDGALFRCQGILECIKLDNANPKEIDAIKKLKDDHVIILGRKVSSYAVAALDILDAETYNGSDEEVLELISELKEFVNSLD